MDTKNINETNNNESQIIGEGNLNKILDLKI